MGFDLPPIPLSLPYLFYIYRLVVPTCSMSIPSVIGFYIHRNPCPLSSLFTYWICFLKHVACTCNATPLSAVLVRPVHA
ncbi:hypothetical protein CPB83DRAFT_843329 [Crepidotus variabilis]|uniref:Uncharacterized protein n=1 Tax=Crepidotus variabilis TaxID=179855 RepID=A0A9P6JWE4_9AGAR|nr:hypothetical protein CPB83DRAFT_843329 [Crepidotus variabilis]